MYQNLSRLFVHSCNENIFLHPDIPLSFIVRFHFKKVRKSLVFFISCRVINEYRYQKCSVFLDIRNYRQRLALWSSGVGDTQKEARKRARKMYNSIAGKFHQNNSRSLFLFWTKFSHLSLSSIHIYTVALRVRPQKTRQWICIFKKQFMHASRIG